MTDGAVIRHFDEQKSDSMSEDLMVYILTSIPKVNDSVSFTCPIGMAHTYMQRVRQRIVRLRKHLKTEGKTVAQFRLKTKVRTDPAFQLDTVTVTREITEGNMLSEILLKSLAMEAR